MSQYGAYKLTDFMRDDFPASQFFALIDLLEYETAVKDKVYKDADRKAKKKGK